MALLDELFGALQNAQTPWAQEALRRMSTGEDLSGIDAELAQRRPRQSAAPSGPSPGKAPPPSADVRVPGVGPATTTTDARPDAGPDFSSNGVAPLAKFLGIDGLLPNNESAQVKKLTYDTLVGRGMDAKTAELVARQPALLKSMLPTLVGKKAEDQWKMEKVGEDENGRAVYAWTNPRTREMKPVVQGGMPTVVGGAAIPTDQPVPAGPTMSITGNAAAAAVPAPASVPSQAAVAAPAAMTAIPPPPPGVNPIEWRKEMAKKAADEAIKKQDGAIDDRYKLQDAISSIDSSWRAANEVKNHPGFGDIAGRPFGGEMKVKGVGVDMADLTPGTSQADAFNLHKNLVAKAALTTLERLKQQSAVGATGFGALSEKELALIENAIGNLKLSSSKEELAKGYEKFQDALMGARERLIERYKGKYGNVDPGVPSKQTLFDGAAASAIEEGPRQYTRPNTFVIPGLDIGIQLPFTKTTPGGR